MMSKIITIHGETWPYDFGSKQFIQYLNIEKDEVVSIHKGDYGGTTQ
jgi:hypothetical protein